MKTILSVFILALALSVDMLEGAAKPTTKAPASATTAATKLVIPLNHTLPTEEAAKENATNSEIRKLLDATNTMSSTLETIEKGISAPLPVSVTQDLAAIDAKTNGKAPSSPKKSLNLALLDDADNNLATVGAALDDKTVPSISQLHVAAPASPPQVAVLPPAKPAAHASMIDGAFAPPPDPPVPVNSAKQAAMALEQKNLARQASHSQPNAAQHDLHDADSASSHGNQSMVIGASVGGSVAGVALVCGVVAAVVIGRKRSQKGKVKGDQEDLTDIKNLGDDANIE